MNLRLAPRRLMTLLAVLCIALASMSAPPTVATARAAAAQRTSQAAVSARQGPVTDVDGARQGPLDPTEAGGTVMGDMACCPPDRPAPPDCDEGCPLMALCLAGMASLPPVPVAAPGPTETRADPCWPAAAVLSGVHASPLPEPPRS